MTEWVKKQIRLGAAEGIIAKDVSMNKYIDEKVNNFNISYHS